VEPIEAAEPEISHDYADGGDFELPAIVLAVALFVSLYLPWYAILSGWGLRVGDEAGLLALAVVLLEVLRLTGSWTSHGSRLVAFCVTVAAGVMGISTVIVLRWGSGAPIKFSTLRYGAWIGLAAGILLVIVGVLQLNAVRRTAP
jgi:hypothetical protein